MSYFDTIGIKEDYLDAFFRLRTSSPETIFDSKQIFDNSPLFWDDAQTSGSGTSSTYNTNQASTTIAVGNLTAGKRVRQTKRRFNYEPGKSQLMLLTGVLGAGAAGITRRVGLLDDNNGVFFGLVGTTLQVGLRTYTSGSAVTATYAQSAWNVDKMDGTGKSGITLDASKSQIMLIDFEWLGVGSIRFGWVINKVPYYCHQIDNANNLNIVYMSTPNLPLRYEIENDGTGAAASLVHICSTVASEGGSQSSGILRSASSGNTQLDANAAGTLYAGIGIRLKTAYIGTTINLLHFSLMGSTANDNFLWDLRFNPTVAGTFTYADETNSAVQTAKGATANTVTGGLSVASGYVKSGESVTGDIVNALQLGSTIAGVRDEFVLCIMPVGSSSNLDVYLSITWRELL